MNPNQDQQSGYPANPNASQQYSGTDTQHTAISAGQQFPPHPDQPYQPSQYQEPPGSHSAGISQQYGAPHDGFGPAPTTGTTLAPAFPPPSQQMSGGLSNYPPALPPRHPQGAYNPPPQKETDGALQFPPPPQQTGSYQPGDYAHTPPYSHDANQSYGEDDLSSPIHYTRDPHKLIAYLVPFPKPQIHGIDPSSIPERFLIYTPPPPPLSKPAEGEKEGKVHKVQRKWQEEVREAKTSTAKTASWKGVKSKVTKGISHAMDLTKNSNIDFLNRIPGTEKESGLHDPHAHDGIDEDTTTHRTVGLEEMILIYPPSVHGTEAQVRAEFINSMLRSKSKAQRDAIIASGLLPVSAAIDLLATVVWPFGGLLEIDSVWAYSSIRGAKAARSVTKRLTFRPEPRIELLHRYLAARCAERDAMFRAAGPPPTETEVLEAIGWAPALRGGATANWEDEQWEVVEVKEDLRNVMKKGAKEWGAWCKGFAKDPEKAVKK
ncbi:MAG: hypothetical protein LQ347_000765 [Umbilicaria vellea]|nr:MAG: hypothetical protein LQ347_000765 [Umbilicaria vellea]